MNLHGVLRFTATNGAAVNIHARDVFLVSNAHNDNGEERHVIVMLANGQGYDVEADQWHEMLKVWNAWHQFGDMNHAN